MLKKNLTLLNAQEELHDYYRLLAVLEQELQRTTPGKNTQMRPSNLLQFRQSSTAANRGSGNSGGDTVIEADGEVGIGGARSAAVDSLAATTEPSGLTLLRLKAWLQEPIERCSVASVVLSRVCYAFPCYLQTAACAVSRKLFCALYYTCLLFVRTFV